MRFLFHLPRHTVRLFFWAVALGAVLFLALTRTEVGRDALRQQIEQQFAEAYAGRLEMEQLTGNLVGSLFAHGVRLYDPAGNLVLQVDRVAAHPRWRDLFRQRITLARLTLQHPVLTLVQDSSGAWNLAAAFRDRAPDITRAPARWSFNATRLHIQNGVLRTRSAAARPAVIADGQVFDFFQAELHTIQASLGLDWQPQFRQIDVNWLAAGLADPAFALDGVQGQLVLFPDSLALNDLNLRAGQTQLRLDASLGGLATLRTDDSTGGAFDLTLRPSTLDADVLRRLVPALPLAGVLQLETHIQGRLDQIAVEDFTLQTGATRLAGQGTFTRTADALAFTLSLPDSRALGTDLRRALPTVPWPPGALPDSLHFALKAQGRLPRTSGLAGLYVAAEGEARSELGHVAGTATVQHPGQVLAWTAALQFDRLDTGRLSGQEPLAGRWNGRLEVEGSGQSLEEIDGTLDLRLGPSTLAQRRIDSLHVQSTFHAALLEGTVLLRQQGGVLATTAQLDLREPLPTYHFDGTTQDLDLGPLLRRDSLTTRLTTRFTLAGQGTTLTDWAGDATVFVDEGFWQYGADQRQLSPHQITLSAGPTAAGQAQVRIGGDVLTLQLTGDARPESLLRLTRHWVAAFQREMDRMDAHRHAQVLPSDSISFPSTASLTAAPLPANEPPLALEGTLHIHRPDVLATLLPMLPVQLPGLATRFHLLADTRTLDLSGTLQGDVFTPPLQAHRVRGDWHGRVSLDGPMAQTAQATLKVWADSIRLGTQQVHTPVLDLQLGDRHGTLNLTTTPDGPVGLSRLATTFDLLPDRLRLHLDSLRLHLGQDTWSNPDRPALDLFADVLVIPDLRLEQQARPDAPPQRLRLQGILSPHPQDTLFAEVNALALGPLADLLLRKTRLDGSLNGQLAFTGIGRQPELTGQLFVRAFALDQRILGDLVVTSAYVPGEPEVGLALTLSPTTDKAEAYAVVENQLRLGGTFRLPATDPASGLRDDGMLDLRLQATRADLFFFDYIIPGVLTDIRGYLAGQGTIRGTFRRPVFGAELTAHDGAFRIPEFNLDYTLEGEVKVDAEGVRLQEARVRDDTGGQAHLRGDVLFNDYRFFTFNLAGTLDRFRIMNVARSDDLPFYGHIWASGDATLTGPLNAALLRSPNAVTTPESEIFIPVVETASGTDRSFILFADSTGNVPDLQRFTRRANVLAGRPQGERLFLDGLDLELNLHAPPGSTLHLVIDPLLGDVINAVGSGRVQISRDEGDFFTNGQIDIASGDYLFTATEVFYRRFLLDPGGTITWDGDPINALLNIPATYRTRASTAGLPISQNDQTLIPLLVNLDIQGRVYSPEVSLRLMIDRQNLTEGVLNDYQAIETVLNQPERAAEYATSVLLTNSFRLTTESLSPETGGDLAFHSVSQIVASQINRFLSATIPNLDLNFGLQGQSTQDLDVTYGVALRLLDERLIIRGEGVYTGANASAGAAQPDLQGEFTVEVKLNPRVSVQVFYRREGDVLAENTALTNTTGAGISYQTEFPTWRSFLHRLFGWMRPDRETVSRR
jgi:hypothetical protein